MIHLWKQSSKLLTTNLSTERIWSGIIKCVNSCSFYTDAPEITCNATHVTLFEGQILEFPCDVTSKEDVVIHWYKSGHRIYNAVTTNSRGPARRDVTRSTLGSESAEASLSGVYQIEANNSVGSSTSEVTVTVLGIVFDFITSVP